MEFMVFLKNLPTWLKGGIISLGIVLVISTIVGILLPHDSMLEFISAPLYFGGFFFIWGDEPHGFLQNTLAENRMVEAIAVLAFCFLLGTMVGLIVKKLKKIK